MDPRITDPHRSPAPSRDWGALCAEAEDALACLMQHKEGDPYPPVARATREVIGLRDWLLASDDPARRACLDQVNALLSSLAALAYPLAGIKWKRLEQAHRVLQELKEAVH